MKESDIRQTTSNWYKNYYARKGADRNNPLKDKSGIFQLLAQENAFIRALASTGINPETSTLLDVGCGTGQSVINFVKLGFLPENIAGIDILDDRIQMCRRIFPKASFVCADASKLPFGNDTFDIVCESTMFIQITDDDLAGKIAAEMVRATKTDGHLILIDWVVGKPFNKDYRAFTKSRLKRLFYAGDKTALTGAFDGPLVPPVGRFLSARLPWLYFAAQTFCPFLTGQKVFVLKKLHGHAAAK